VAVYLLTWSNKLYCSEVSGAGDVIMRAWNDKKDKLMQKEQAHRDAKEKELEK